MKAARRKRSPADRYDPSKTFSLRVPFVKRLSRKFAILRAKVYDLVVTKKAFAKPVRNFAADQQRDDHGRWSTTGGTGPEDAATHMQYQDEPTWLAAGVMSSGGFTYKPLEGLTPTTGTVVSLPREAGYEKAVPAADFATNGKQILSEHLKRVRDDLKAGKIDKTHAHVGAWHDTATGRVVLDVNEVYQDKQEAINVGKRRKQDAVFDLGTFETTDLRDEAGRRPTGNARSAHRGRNRRRTGAARRSDGGTLTVNDYSFAPVRDGIVAFAGWLGDQLDTLFFGPQEEQAWAAYVAGGYRKGFVRSYDETAGKQLTPSPDFKAGSRSGFAQLASTPKSRDAVDLLGGRAYDEMEHVMADMETRMTRVLADAFLADTSPDGLAAELDDVIDFAEARAAMTAGTEIVRAQGAGQLAGYEVLGLEEVEVAVEFTTMGDGDVCKTCERLEGKVFSLEDADGIIPVHPWCRCAFSVVLVPVSERRRG